MIDKIMKAAQDVADTLRDQANSFGENAKEKSYEVIDDWMKIFPRLESYGLRINSFALSVAISPSLDVELVGNTVDFSPERLQIIQQEIKGNAALSSVFTTIRSTFHLYRKVRETLPETFILRLRIKITPEIKVFLGEPPIC